jgi:hypothetical protein
MRARVVTAFFGGPLDAQRAFERLVAGGVRPADVRLVPKVVTRSDDLGIRATTKASEGAALGAVSGGLAGALAGALGAGGALVVPHVGVVVAGPLVAALAGAGLVGALGTALGGLLGARLPEYETAYLRDAVATGGALLAVHCDAADLERVRDVLAASGGSGMAERTATKRTFAD